MGHVEGLGGWRFSSFRRTIERLIGDTVRIQTNDSAFRGKLADVHTTFVTLVKSTTSSPRVAGVDGKDSSCHCHLTYIPFRHINAVTAV